MKNTTKYIIAYLAVALTGCSDSFLDRPPYGALPSEKYYQNEDQIRAATGYLYASTWFDYIDKAASGIELIAGNAMSTDPNIDRFAQFSLTPDYNQVIFAWRAFYGTAGRATLLIDDLSKVTPSQQLSDQHIKSGIGEARFIRALAYFYLVQLWGDVPIVADVKGRVTDTQIPKAPVSDVYRFIIEDLEYSEVHSPAVDPGRVTSYAAKALLAKVYLTKAGITKSNEDYAKAATYAKDVIDNGPYNLLSDYGDLWTSENDNSEESIFALQWVACGTSVQWGNNNTLQAYYAYNGEIAGVGDGWNMIQPTLDLLNAYEEGDMRRRWTVMEDGNSYPNLRAKDGGLTYTRRDANGNMRSNTGANIKKHIVGSPDDEEVCFMSTGLNTPLIRYADVLLTLAEARLAGQGSTSDAEALAAFNEVRERAGLPSKETISFMDILKERRTEFAIEFQYWFDILRFHNLNPDEAITYLSNQNRSGTIQVVDGEDVISFGGITPSENDFLLPIPANDAAANPRLLEAPVSYYN